MGFEKESTSFLMVGGALLLSVEVPFWAVITLPDYPEVRKSPERRRKWGNKSDGPLFGKTRYAIATT